MKNHFSILTTLCFSTAIMTLLLLGCSPSIAISVSPDNTISYSFSATIDERIAGTARSFSGTTEDMPMFNAKKTEQALHDAGLESVTVSLPDSLSLTAKGNLTIEDTSQQSEILPLVPGALIFGDTLNTNGLKVKEIKLALSPETFKQLLRIIPPETAEYADLLSAPVLTEETMSKDEYTELIAAIYGETAKQALTDSMISIAVQVPSQILSAKVSANGSSSKVSEKKVIFSIPLVDFLIQTQEIIFCIQF